MKQLTRQPAISISTIIPLYNGERFIGQALASVAAQTLPPCELIVVDDGSVDGGAAIVESFKRTFPVTLIRKANGGQSSARNFGVAHASGDLIALLDQDDVWYPNHLHALSRAFVARQPIPLGWTYGDLDEIDEAGNLISRGVLHRTASTHPKRELLDCLRQDQFILPSASLISREAFLAVGGFDERLSGYEDEDLFVRLFTAGYQNLYIDRPLSQWRIHGESTSFSTRMNRSRMVFAKKLVDAYPDDGLRNVFYARDHIVPRFLHQAAEAMRRALRAGLLSIADECRADIGVLESLVDARQRHHLFRENLLVTVVVPLHNGGRYIEEALKSVLEQTVPADEIIVVDGGSEDGGPEIVTRMAQAHPITLIRRTAGGPSRARNVGIDQSHGDLIAFLGQDDVWSPTHLAELVKPFREQRSRSLGWSYSNVDEIDSDGALLTKSLLSTPGVPHPKTNITDCLRHDMLVRLSASVVSRKALQAVGGFDEQLAGYEDDDLFIRLYRAGFDNVYVQAALTRCRTGDETTPDSAMVARSRMTFVRKLAGMFPDGPEKRLSHLRDLIVPRFLRHATEHLRRALRSGNSLLADQCADDIRTLRGYVDEAARQQLIRAGLITSVVIPLYNGGRFIAEAIESVLRQVHAPDEVIVVDDGSTDEGPAIVRDMAKRQPITLLTRANGGVSSARNFGISRAHGDLIAFLDQDDVWFPSHLAELIKPFRGPQGHTLGWTYGNVDQIDRTGKLIATSVLNTFQQGAHPKTTVSDCLRHDVLVRPSAALVSRPALDAVSGFDTGLSGYEDDDLFRRLIQAGYGNVFIDQPLSCWRVHEDKAEWSTVASGRMTYMRKLADLYPDDSAAGMHLTRDLILPRFLHSATETMRSALRAGDRELADRGKTDIETLEQLAGEGALSPTARTNLLTTVVIPLYNGARTIEEAIESVLKQTLPPDEIIVVDDGSYDEGPAIVARMAARYPITLFKKPNGGQSSARNLGISHAHGDLIALLDQDDTWYPLHLAELAKPFHEPRSRRLGWSYSNLDEVDRNGNLISQSVLKRTGCEHPKTNVIDCLRHDMFVLPSASVISRKAFEAVGGFDERLSGYEDDDLFIRLLKAGYDNVYVDKALSRWRIYEESTSFSPRMAVSRMIYAHKLIAAFPDEPARNLFYARDLLLPRFLHHVAETLRRALRSGDTALADACVRDIGILEISIPEEDRQRVLRTNLLTSAVIPLHNGAATIEEALCSVLDQTLRPDEIIVVDDGSTDDGPAIVRRMADGQPITLLSQAQGGVSSARNLGVRHAHGDLIALLDQDDIWYPSHLADMVPAFLERRSRPLGWVYSDLDEIDRTGELLTQSVLTASAAPHPKTSISDCLRQDMLVMPSASLFSRRAFEAVGGFDERLTRYEDDDFFLRLLHAGYDNVYINKALTRWRINRDGGSVSRRLARCRMTYARKLIETFPDEPAIKRYPVRDLIAPRFAHNALTEARKALGTTDHAWIEACFDNLGFLDALLKKDEGTGLNRREPLISAIVPLYNGAPYIERAIRSIFAQSLEPDEIIVVDDGSIDGGAAIVERLAETYPIKLIRQENAGQSAARNAGVDFAHGDLIAFLDQDDFWYPDHLAELAKPFLEKRSVELGWAYSNLDEINVDGNVVCRGFLATLHTQHPKRDVFACLANDMFVLPSACLISRKAFLAVDGFDERLSGYEDDDLFLRLFLAGFDNVYLEQPLSAWRIHNNSSSYSSRMGVSRAAYARKLIKQFPDDPDMTRFYIRDLIAPRFFRSTASELRKAVRKGTVAEQREAFRNLRFITRHLARSKRIPLQLFILPPLRIPFFRRFALRFRTPIRSMLRWVA